MAANRQMVFVQTFFAGVATVATLALFHAAQPDDAKIVGAPVNLADRSFATDGGTGAAGGWFRSSRRPGREWTNRPFEA